jgi:hypothetical protein
MMGLILAISAFTTTHLLVCSLSNRLCSRIFRYFSLFFGLIAPSCATAASSFGLAIMSLRAIEGQTQLTLHVFTRLAILSKSPISFRLLKHKCIPSSIVRYLNLVLIRYPPRIVFPSLARARWTSLGLCRFWIFVCRLGW